MGYSVKEFLIALTIFFLRVPLLHFHISHVPDSSNYPCKHFFLEEEAGVTIHSLISAKIHFVKFKAEQEISRAYFCPGQENS